MVSVKVKYKGCNILFIITGIFICGVFLHDELNASIYVNHLIVSMTLRRQTEQQILGPTTNSPNTLHKDNIPNPIASNKYHIFQIGFNKAGTTSIANLFNENNFPACHWGCHMNFSQNLITLARFFYEEYKTHKHLPFPLANNFNKTYLYYGDFGVFIQQKQTLDIKFVNKTYNEIGDPNYRTWYKVLTQMEINMQRSVNKTHTNILKFLYILNIRDINHWLKSRFLHHNHGHDLVTFAQRAMRIYNKIEILKLWKRMWYEYICDLLQYFRNNNIMNKLLIFDIEYDSIDKLIMFFDDFGIKLNKSLYSVENNGKQKHKRMYNMWLKNWNNTIKNTTQLLHPNHDGFDNEYQRILNVCSQ